MTNSIAPACPETLRFPRLVGIEIAGWTVPLEGCHHVRHPLALRPSEGSEFPLAEGHPDPVRTSSRMRTASLSSQMHPKHNWFMSTALSEDDVDRVLMVSDEAFGRVAKQFFEMRGATP
jgi:hypothetical protein